MNNQRLELKVGIFVMAAALCVAGLLWTMGEISFGSTHRLAVDFSHSGNVVKGAPVKLAGIIVGKVAAVDPILTQPGTAGTQPLVRMQLAIDSSRQLGLREDATVSISSQGPLGEPYLEINPGTEAKALPPDTVLRGMDPLRIEVVTHQLEQFLNAAQAALKNKPEVIGQLLENASSLAVNANNTLGENRANLKELIVDLKTAAQNGNNVIQKAAVALDDVRKVSSSLTTDEGEQLKVALKNAALVTEKMNNLATKADHMLGQLESGQGTVGLMIKDKQVYEDLRSLLNDLKKNPWKLVWKN